MTIISANTRCCGTILYGLTLAIAGAIKLGYDHRQTSIHAVSSAPAVQATAPASQGISSIGTEQVTSAPVYVRLRDSAGNPFVEELFQNQNTLDRFTNTYLSQLLSHWKQVYGSNFQWQREDVQDLTDKIDLDDDKIITEEELRTSIERLAALRQGHSQQVIDALGRIR